MFRNKNLEIKWISSKCNTNKVKQHTHVSLGIGSIMTQIQEKKPWAIVSHSQLQKCLAMEKCIEEIKAKFYPIWTWISPSSPLQDYFYPPEPRQEKLIIYSTSSMARGIYHVSFNIYRTRTLDLSRDRLKEPLCPRIQIYYDILGIFRRQLKEEQRATESQRQ